jgi:hypothetical protein
MSEEKAFSLKKIERMRCGLSVSAVGPEGVFSTPENHPGGGKLCAKHP